MTSFTEEEQKLSELFWAFKLTNCPRKSIDMKLIIIKIRANQSKVESLEKKIPERFYWKMCALNTWFYPFVVVVVVQVGVPSSAILRLRRMSSEGKRDAGMCRDLRKRRNKLQKVIASQRNKNSFFKNGPITASFCLFTLFSRYNFNNTNWKKLDGVLGIRTRGCRMVGADETTELWRPP